jgi:hypothetical protein
MSAGTVDHHTMSGIGNHRLQFLGKEATVLETSYVDTELAADVNAMACKISLRCPRRRSVSTHHSIAHASSTQWRENGIKMVANSEQTRLERRYRQ